MIQAKRCPSSMDLKLVLMNRLGDVNKILARSKGGMVVVVEVD
jgi:hypothetical protein